MTSTPRDLASASIASRIAYWFLLIGAVVDGLALIMRIATGPWLPLWWEMFHAAVRAGTVISFLAWLYDRYRSLLRIGWAADHTPFAAVAWFFVPLLNFYRPYLVVEEMWSATDPQATTEIGRSRTVATWWLMLLAAPLVALIERPVHAFDLALLDLLLLVLMDTLNIGAAILAMRLILLIDERWRRKAIVFAAQQKKAAMTMPVPPPPPAPAVVAPAPAPFFREEVDEPLPPPPPPPPQSPPRPQPVARPLPPPMPVWKEEPLPPLQPLRAVPELGEPLRVMRVAAVIMSCLAVGHLALIATVCAVRVISSFDAPEPLGILTRIVVLATLFGTVIGFIPAIHLMRFVSATGRYLRSGNGVDLEALLVMQG
ncbi:MAG TPA: DUF4328 domain-containing protein, partial [Thermoanaerobaculia bacterium]|nr:DUF4328 domain-containing protein [Thermoanaerobaculia bacterium]